MGACFEEGYLKSTKVCHILRYQVKFSLFLNGAVTKLCESAELNNIKLSTSQTAHLVKECHKCAGKENPQEANMNFQLLLLVLHFEKYPSGKYPFLFISQDLKHLGEIPLAGNEVREVPASSTESHKAPSKFLFEILRKFCSSFLLFFVGL